MELRGTGRNVCCPVHPGSLAAEWTAAQCPSEGHPSGLSLLRMKIFNPLRADPNLHIEPELGEAARRVPRCPPVCTYLPDK